MSRKNRKYEDEYEDEYEEEYEDDYDDYDDYEDEPVKRKNPLKGFVIALVILVLLLGVIIALLYIQLQSAEKRVGELTETLSAAQTELNRVQAEAAMATPVPAATPEPAQVPEATPVPTEEPVVTPEPTAAPTPTPAPLLKDTVTDEMLNGAFRPADENWFDSARTAYVTSEYMLAMHWGPSMAYLENGVLYHDNAVEMLATQENWTLIRTENDVYGWVVTSQLSETAPAGAATAAPAAATVAPEAPATATPAAADNPI